jgi:hypothetical protein
MNIAETCPSPHFPKGILSPNIKDSQWPRHSRGHRSKQLKPLRPQPIRERTRIGVIVRESYQSRTE